MAMIFFEILGVLRKLYFTHYSLIDLLIYHLSLRNTHLLKMEALGATQAWKINNTLLQGLYEPLIFLWLHNLPRVWGLIFCGFYMHFHNGEKWPKSSRVHDFLAKKIFFPNWPDKIPRSSQRLDFLAVMFYMLANDHLAWFSKKRVRRDVLLFFFVGLHSHHVIN